MSFTMSTVKRRACVACTAAKAKCTPQTASLCQRCARLGKSCTYLDLPQTKRKHKPGPSRVELLERKVDQLNSHLSALTRQNEQISPDISNPPTNDTNSSTNEAGLSHDLRTEPPDITAMLNTAKDSSHGRDPPTRSALEGQPSIMDRGLLSEAEAECFIKAFQLELVPKFPFVLIPHGDTAARLQNREPFLFLCIVSASISAGHPLCKTVAEEIMKHVTLRIVAGSERTLELLRGLLVCSTWYSYPAEKYHPRLVMFIQFCVSILYDLDLHKKPTLSSDERQALLGTYWLSAGLYGTLGRPITMKHDTRINRCLESTKSTEHLSDRWIAPLVHLQSFLVAIDETYDSMQENGGRALVQVTRSSLQRQFDNVLARIERDLESCPSPTGNVIRLEVKYVELRIEELSLHERLWISEPNSAARTAMLMSMIQRSKQLIQTISTLPKSDVIQMTIPTAAHICAAVGYMASAVFILLNLIVGTAASDKEAQLQAVIDEAEYPKYIKELATVLEERLEGVSAEYQETDVVGSLCSKMRLLARCYPHQIKAVVGNALPQVRRENTTVIPADTNDVPMTPQVWPSIYNDLDEIFPMDDVQWDSLLSSFTGFS